MPNQFSQRAMTPKIAITGSFGCMDIGDEAMLTEDLNFIISDLKISRENIYLFGSDAKYTSLYHQHPIELCFSTSSIQRCFEALNIQRDRSGYKQKIKGFLKTLLKRDRIFIDDLAAQAAKSCNVLLVTGGGTINTRSPVGESLRRMYSLISYFRSLGKPIFMSGQTIGPLGLYEEHDLLAKDIIESVDFLSVRDKLYSKRYINLIKAKPKKFLETFDDAYTLPYKDVILPSNVTEFLNSRETFAVNVTDYTADLSEQRIFIAELCEALVESFNSNIVLVSHTPKDFYNLCIIFDMIKNSLKEFVVLPDTRMWHGQSLKKLISKCRVAIGGRYHFIVFAGTSNTPFVGMCGNHYSYIKQDGFARALGLEDFIMSEKETWNIEAILAKVKAAYKLDLNLEDKFSRPSVSMQYFKEWLEAM